MRELDEGRSVRRIEWPGGNGEIFPRGDAVVTMECGEMGMVPWIKTVYDRLLNTRQLAQIELWWDEEE
jgi:hypothetical protein